jgi:hypothetical protein
MQAEVIAVTPAFDAAEAVQVATIDGSFVMDVDPNTHSGGSTLALEDRTFLWYVDVKIGGLSAVFHIQIYIS